MNSEQVKLKTIVCCTAFTTPMNRRFRFCVLNFNIKLRNISQKAFLIAVSRMNETTRPRDPSNQPPPRWPRRTFLGVRECGFQIPVTWACISGQTRGKPLPSGNPTCNPTSKTKSNIPIHLILVYLGLWCVCKIKMRLFGHWRCRMATRLSFCRRLLFSGINYKFNPFVVSQMLIQSWEK